jgi:2-haloalkanoic acid dehalogenase type II
MKVADFQVLTFDCYGTLIDWERGLLAALRPFLDRHGKQIDDDAVLEAFGAAESACEAATPSKLYPEILADSLRALCAQWGITPDPADLQRFGASVGDWPAFADSADALRYLKQHYKLVILSNVDRDSFAKSNKKLGVTFDAICTAQDIGSYKPSPRNFEYAIKRVAELGFAKDAVLHTAQSLFHDHAPARALGLRSIWINRRQGKTGGGATPPATAKPDFTVGSMAEFVELHRQHSA